MAVSVCLADCIVVYVLFLLWHNFNLMRMFYKVSHREKTKGGKNFNQDDKKDHEPPRVDEFHNQR